MRKLTLYEKQLTQEVIELIEYIIMSTDKIEDYLANADIADLFCMSEKRHINLKKLKSVLLTGALKINSDMYAVAFINYCYSLFKCDLITETFLLRLYTIATKR